MYDCSHLVYCLFGSRVTSSEAAYRTFTSHRLFIYVIHYVDYDIQDATLSQGPPRERRDAPNI